MEKRHRLSDGRGAASSLHTTRSLNQSLGPARHRAWAARTARG
jgi:hypothetical protein